MKIRILGTAAAEGWPALFCECDACRKARELGGKNIRTRASIQVDDELKVDFPPDTMNHVHRDKLDLAKLRYLFFTHSHSDHMATNDIRMIVPPFGHNHFDEQPLQIFLSQDAAERLRERVGQAWNPPAININTIKSFQPIQAGETLVTPLLGQHMLGEECLFYLMEKVGRRFIYASDTGPFPEETFEFLADKQIDLLISECTFGPPMEEHSGHMGLGDVLRVCERLRSTGTMGVNTPVWITHFSHNGRVTHEEFESIANPYGVQVAYDGVVIEL